MTNGLCTCFALDNGGPSKCPVHPTDLSFFNDNDGFFDSLMDRSYPDNSPALAAAIKDIAELKFRMDQLLGNGAAKTQKLPEEVEFSNYLDLLEKGEFDAAADLMKPPKTSLKELVEDVDLGDLSQPLPSEVCDYPPEGYRCTLKPRHEGPCATLFGPKSWDPGQFDAWQEKGKALFNDAKDPQLVGYDTIDKYHAELKRLFKDRLQAWGERDESNRRECQAIKERDEARKLLALESSHRNAEQEQADYAYDRCMDTIQALHVQLDMAKERAEKGDLDSWRKLEGALAKAERDLRAAENLRFNQVETARKWAKAWKIIAKRWRDGCNLESGYGY